MSTETASAPLPERRGPSPSTSSSSPLGVSSQQPVSPSDATRGSAVPEGRRSSYGEYGGYPYSSSQGAYSAVTGYSPARGGGGSQGSGGTGGGSAYPHHHGLPPPPYYPVSAYGYHPHHGAGGSSGGGSGGGGAAYGYPNFHKSEASRRFMKSPLRSTATSTATTPTAITKTPKPEMSQQIQDDIEQERMRAAVDPVQVDPMKTDFHFFGRDVKKVVQRTAQAQVDRDAPHITGGKHLFLLHSNMNTRLLKQWLRLSEKKRSEYFTREEEDRQRFMNDDEIASRHCATLTARARSPRVETLEEEAAKAQRGANEDGESPPKKIKLEEGHHRRRSGVMGE